MRDPDLTESSRIYHFTMKHVFLTGVPGVGKTTLVKKVCDALSGLSVSGFYTEEVREHGRRVGFDVVTVSGDRGRLSRVSSGSATGGREYRVGQYVVDLQSFESLALPLFRNMQEGSGKQLFVMDEVGKMELFSQPFIRAVRQILEKSCCSVLGTIPVPKGKPLALVEELRSRADVKIFMVTKENRDVIFDDIVSAVRECLK
ncbi:cancer-related nucleoside-triphosphatase [Danio aesculapii]|uniref:cancer-related nucleoside-triphosphatase n=1 Tax=Danio aesculapii TaxID=1142201 RepID=UPI0024BF9C06|nr:cancer-related nucleoside-triphosphatase [Danio aesculapii]